MNRRTLLRTGATVAALGLAGCTQPGDDPSDDLPPTDTPEGQDTSEPTPEPGVESRTFEVIDSACGEGRNEATVRRDGGRVIVEGVIGGRNSCYTARLQSVSYEGEELRVEVEAYQPDEMAACAQCLVDIEYEATIAFDGGSPDTVIVTHNGELVTSQSATE